MQSARSFYRLGIAVALATVLFLVWAIGALGIIGAGGRPDRMYVAVPAVLVLGTVLARLRSRGMALTMVAAALTHAVITVVALATGLQHTEGASVVEILGLNAMYAALFLLAAWLFGGAASRAPAR